MSKQVASIVKPVLPVNASTFSQQATVFCGIDVSAETLAVAVIEPDQPSQQREFANRASGHKSLIGWLHKHKAVALALDAAEGIELAVLGRAPEGLLRSPASCCTPFTASSKAGLRTTETCVSRS